MNAPIPLPVHVQTLPRFLPETIHNALTSAPLEALVMRCVFTPYQGCKRAHPTTALVYGPNGLTPATQQPVAQQACQAMDAFFDAHPAALTILTDRWMDTYHHYDTQTADDTILVIAMPEGIGILHNEARCVVRTLDADFAPYWDDASTYAQCLQDARERCAYPPFGLVLLPGASSAHSILTKRLREQNVWGRWTAIVQHHLRAPFPFHLHPAEAS